MPIYNVMSIWYTAYYQNLLVIIVIALCKSKSLFLVLLLLWAVDGSYDFNNSNTREWDWYFWTDQSITTKSNLILIWYCYWNHSGHLRWPCLKKYSERRDANNEKSMLLMKVVLVPYVTYYHRSSDVLVYKDIMLQLSLIANNFSLSASLQHFFKQQRLSFQQYNTRQNNK